MLVERNAIEQGLSKNVMIFDGVPQLLLDLYLKITTLTERKYVHATSRFPIYNILQKCINVVLLASCHIEENVYIFALEISTIFVHEKIACQSHTSISINIENFFC